MRLGSVCSGIGGAELGKPPGWETSFVSEIEKFPREVLAHRFPDVKLYGDFTQIKDEQVDVLVGGVPCQSFSIAGKRRLDNDERGQLIYKFIDLAHESGARWFVLENVLGLLSPDKSNGAISAFSRFLAFATGRPELGSIARFGKAGWVAGTAGGFSIAWRVFDARGFGVPQRRRRVWIVGCLGDDGRTPAGVLFERNGSGRNVETSGSQQPPDPAGVAETTGGNESPRIIAQEDVNGRLSSSEFCSTLRAQHAGRSQVLYAHHSTAGVLRRAGKTSPTLTTHAGGRPLVYSQSKGRYSEDEHAPTLTATAAKGAGHTPMVNYHKDHGTVRHIDHSPALTTRAGSVNDFNQGLVYEDAELVNWHKGNGTARPSDFAPTLSTFVGREFDTNQGVPITRGRLRYLTELECERLQGFPDGWTNIPGATKGKRYVALGNAFVPAVCRWVLDGIAEQEQPQPPEKNQ